MSRFESPLAKRRERREIAAETLGLLSGWSLEIKRDGNDVFTRGFWSNRLHREMQAIGHCGVDGIASTQILGRLENKRLVRQIPGCMVTDEPADCYERALEPWHLTETGKIACAGAYQHIITIGTLGDFSLPKDLVNELNGTLDSDPIALLDPDAWLLVPGFSPSA